MNKNKIKKGIACTLTTAIVVTGTGLTSVSADEAKEKEEVVYINQDAKGKTTSINVVNIFGKGHVEDYGDYSQVKMLNTTDSITKKGNKVTFTTNKNKVYYQGTLNDTQIPWNISIDYKLDGKSISPKKLAGSSGQLEMHILIEENKECKSDFYNQYALQADFTLDSDKCKNIEADGATIANVGNDKQISYTVLPGKGLDTVIKAKVTNFEMDAASINGVKLNLDIDIDDQELMAKVQEIQDATKQLNDGTNDLSKGTKQLKNGGNQLVNGSSSLNEGASTLDNGMSDLNTGVKQMQQALNTLNSKSGDLIDGSDEVLNALKTIQSQLNTVSASSDDLKKLTDSSMQIKQGIDQAYQGALALKQGVQYDSYKATMKKNGLDVDQLSNGNSQAINDISNQINGLQASINQIKSIPDYQSNETYVTQISQLESSIQSLQQIVTLLKGNNAAINGTQQYFNTVSNNVDDLVSGLETLQTKYNEFDQAINDLATNLSDMLLKVNTLKAGINQLVESYSMMDTGMNQYTYGVAKIVASYQQIVDGTDSLASGSKSLVEGSKSLKEGTVDLYNGITSVDGGVKTLHEGTQEFYDQTINVDQEIDDKIDSMLDELSGGDDKVTSFVSEKNTNVKSVQFVIKTTAIKKEEHKSTKEKTTTNKSLFEKLLDLFK